MSTPSLRTLAADCATTNPVLISVSDRLIRNVPAAPFDASIGVKVPASRYCALPTLFALTGSHVELRELLCGALQQSRIERLRCVRLLPGIAVDGRVDRDDAARRAIVFLDQEPGFGAG